jgi:hypothetical protein
MARFATLLLLAYLALVAIATADNVGVDMKNRKLLSGGGALGAFAFSQCHATLLRQTPIS